MHRQNLMVQQLTCGASTLTVASPLASLPVLLAVRTVAGDRMVAGTCDVMMTSSLSSTLLLLLLGRSAKDTNFLFFGGVDFAVATATVALVGGACVGLSSPAGRPASEA